MRALKPATLLLCLAPAIYLTYRWASGTLGFNRIEYVARYTGDWTLRLLLVGLAITPLRRLWPVFSPLLQVRRMIGLAAFAYGTLHFWHYLAIDKLWDGADIRSDFQLRRFYIAGLIGWALMVPLAATSFNGAIRALGPRRWQALHRLVYLCTIAGVVHYYWQAKAANLEPLVYAAILAVLLLTRVVLSVQTKMRPKPAFVSRPKR